MNRDIILELTPDLRRAAKRCIWFEPPEEAVRYPARLAAYILTYGLIEDVRALKAQLSQNDLTELLDRAPPASTTRVPGLIGTSSPAALKPRPCRRARFKRASVDADFAHAL